MENKNNNAIEPNDGNKDEPKPSPIRLLYTDKQNEILNDLNTNPRYIKFFEKYNKRSIDYFKDYYSRTKSDVLINEGRALRDEEDRIMRYQLMAEEYIWHIQQRKLFDLQIRWRAEQVKLDGVEGTADFEEWSENIEKCPFLSPISREEFDLYISFVESSKMENIRTNYFTKWQEYDDFKAQYNDIEGETYAYEIPGWYEYYENQTGLGSLYMLEDIRGEKEKFYWKIYMNDKIKKHEEMNKDKPKPEPDYRPSFRYLDEDGIKEFMQLFEPGNFIRKWEAYYKGKEIEDDQKLDYALYILKSADDNCEMEYNHNWREGILQAAGEYERRYLLADLPKAYNDYLFRINSRLGFDGHFEKRRPFIAALAKEEILIGRELNGEPRDFNF